MILDLGQGKRFVVVPANLGFNYPMILLSDVSFWGEHADELDIWCESHGDNVRVRGMTVDFETDQYMSLFIMRWA